MLVLNSPTPKTNVMNCWTYSSGSRGFGETLVFASEVIDLAAQRGTTEASLSLDELQRCHSGALQPEISNQLQAMLGVFKAEYPLEAAELCAKLDRLGMAPLTTSDRGELRSLASATIKSSILIIIECWEKLVPKKWGASVAVEETEARPDAPDQDVVAHPPRALTAAQIARAAEERVTEATTLATAALSHQAKANEQAQEAMAALVSAHDAKARALAAEESEAMERDDAA